MLISQFRETVSKDRTCVYALDTRDGKLVVSSPGNLAYNTLCKTRLSDPLFEDESEFLGLVSVQRDIGEMIPAYGWAGEIVTPVSISPNIDNLNGHYNYTIIAKFVLFGVNDENAIRTLVQQGDTNSDHVLSITYDKSSGTFSAKCTFFTGGEIVSTIVNVIDEDSVNYLDGGYEVNMFLSIDMDNHIMKFQINTLIETALISSNVSMLNYPINGGLDSSLLKVKCGNYEGYTSYFVIYNKVVHSREYFALRKMLANLPDDLEGLDKWEVSQLENSTYSLNLSSTAYSISDLSDTEVQLNIDNTSSISHTINPLEGNDVELIIQ